MSQPAIDLTSELLRGMRLSGVNYRRIETARPFGVGFSAVAGKAQFHFISRGPVLLRMASGEQFTLESGDALFIPNGDGHALLSDPQGHGGQCGAAAQRNGVQHGKLYQRWRPA
ncbi:AraC family transcriptional regulator [Klebsiella pneumoniae]|nr:AraC family transcriptional regulator [Klebsiella pneumoniae]